MKPELHIHAFEERRETVFKWGVEVRGIENSQHIIGDNASKAIVELLSAYLHQCQLVEDGFQLNHAWFKSDKVFHRLPEFEGKDTLVNKMIAMEKLCEKLAYGSPKPREKLEEVLRLFLELETTLRGMMP